MPQAVQEKTIRFGDVFSNGNHRLYVDGTRWPVGGGCQIRLAHMSVPEDKEWVSVESLSEKYFLDQANESPQATIAWDADWKSAGGGR